MLLFVLACREEISPVVSSPATPVDDPLFSVEILSPIDLFDLQMGPDGGWLLPYRLAVSAAGSYPETDYGGISVRSHLATAELDLDFDEAQPSNVALDAESSAESVHFVDTWSEDIDICTLADELATFWIDVVDLSDESRVASAEGKGLLRLLSFDGEPYECSW